MNLYSETQIRNALNNEDLADIVIGQMRPIKMTREEILQFLEILENK